jgi:4-hydroxy-tetrahydrodipicolinate reductase
LRLRLHAAGQCGADERERADSDGITSRVVSFHDRSLFFSYEASKPREKRYCVCGFHNQSFRFVLCGSLACVSLHGFDVRQREELSALATRTRSVVAANFSAGITVLTELVSLAARLLDRHFEAEIVELHHHGKKDAPSGTALSLGRAVAAARGLDFDEEARLAREGIVGARTQEEIGIVALRAGDAIGDHTVIFGGLGERLELVHRAQSRDGLALGALRAARWVAQQQAGLYSMRDVLGL